MIIAIASDDGMKVAEHPGRCGGFVVFEVGPSTAVRVGYRSNACFAEEEAAQSGSRSPAYEPLATALSDCGALVFRSMDDALLRGLHGSVVEAYACREDSVDRAAQLFAEGLLHKLEDREGQRAR